MLEQTNSNLPTFQPSNTKTHEQIKESSHQNQVTQVRLNITEVCIN